MNEADKLSGSKDKCAFLRVFRCFFVLGVIEALVVRIVLPNKVSGFNEVVMEVAVAGRDHVRMIGVEVAGLAARLDETGELGERGLAAEAMDIPDFCYPI